MVKSVDTAIAQPLVAQLEKAPKPIAKPLVSQLSEYNFTLGQALPQDFRGSLPTIEEIENELDLLNSN